MSRKGNVRIRILSLIEAKLYQKVTLLWELETELLGKKSFSRFIEDLIREGVKIKEKKLMRLKAEKQDKQTHQRDKRMGQRRAEAYK